MAKLLTFKLNGVILIEKIRQGVADPNEKIFINYQNLQKKLKKILKNA